MPAAECLACGGGDLTGVARLDDQPALVGTLWDGEETARGTARGRLDLAACRDCGHVANVAFDPGLVDYDASYDNSLHFSPAFARYAGELAARLVATYGIRGKRVVEIGCGTGEFLQAVCQLGGNTGTGYDPACVPEREIPGVVFVTDYYRPAAGAGACWDLLVCRHVLEHLDDPAALLQSLRSGAAVGGGVLYAEVPSAEFNFGPDGLWDCIYPHVSYFSATSLRCLLERSGFEVVALRPSFGGQFLGAEVRVPGAGPHPGHDPGHGSARPDADRAAVASHLDVVSRFSERWRRSVDSWRMELAARAGKGGVVALWGAGSKGVTFLNAVDGPCRLLVVDRNPRKWGRFLSGTGHRVDSPGTLATVNVSTVLITNPAYRAEVAEQLDELGVTADVVVVS